MTKHGVHKNPFLGWNPPAGDSAWARAEADRRGVKLSTILTEALSEYRAKHQSEAAAEDARPAGSDCPHPSARVHKGLCGACGTNVGTTKAGA